MTNKATVVDLGHNLTLIIGKDGVWLGFKSSEGKEALVHVANCLATGGRMTRQAIAGWCADVQQLYPGPVAYGLRYVNPDKDSGLKAWVGVWDEKETAEDLQKKIREKTEVVPLCAME